VILPLCDGRPRSRRRGRCVCSGGCRGWASAPVGVTGRLRQARVNLGLVLLASVLWVSALSITVEGATSCPEPGEVAARLQVVAPAGKLPGRALLSVAEGALRVQLMRANGTIVGERLLDARYPCAELADAAALVLASWQGEFEAAPVVAPSVEVRPDEVPRREPWLEIGAGLVAAGPRPLSAGGSLSLGLSRGAWGLTFQLMAVDFHRQPIGPGEISWNRSPAALTVRRRFQSSSGLVLGLHGGVAAAALFSRSQGLELSHTARVLDYGPTVGAQLLFDAGSHLLPFLGISSAAWLQRRVIHVTSTDTRILPQVDSWFVLGLCWRVDAN
jgi:hypothetical protein